ncbi:hypothetical protein MAPG_02492 [Magnaporthiopsis poae ATCC 64411]|uniref:Uncharacterized protein n=1 Tax=Magnaporthiopsis poae (strain ATCC 64411 / 73-15) TaxID=644358 RepID=A0A0C4DRI3_MAGP6|nr:hypothetical protein MAPG_02492 [Magnaporthiopsis poae ATCC 64411]
MAAWVLTGEELGRLDAQGSPISIAREQPGHFLDRLYRRRMLPSLSARRLTRYSLDGISCAMASQTWIAEARTGWAVRGGPNGNCTSRASPGSPLGAPGRNKNESPEFMPGENSWLAERGIGGSGT